MLEAIDQVRGHFHGPYNITAFYRACIEKGLLQRERIAPNTFRRVVKAHELLKPDAEVHSKRRLAFAKAHVNELWQADTMVGPYVQQGAGKVQAKLIAFLDDASRVVCHGEFFAADNTEALLACFKTALYKRGLCECLYVDNGSNYSSLEISQVCQRGHHPVPHARPRRRREGQNRALFPHRPRKLPHAKARPRKPGRSQPRILELGGG